MRRNIILFSLIFNFINISFADGKMTGFNTDGEGAVNAIEAKKPIKGKKVVIIGAGGAAKAIAYVAHERGAHIIVLSRTRAKAEKMMGPKKRESKDLEKIAEEYQQGYDVLINCTPDPLPIDPQYIRSDAIIMDIKTFPKITSLLFHAKEK